MTVYFLSTHDNADRAASIENKLRAVMPELIPVADVSTVTPRPRGAADVPACVILAAPSNDPDYVDKFTAVATRHREAIFFILVSDDISAADYKRLMRTGAADWVPTAGVPHEILDIVARRRARDERVTAAAEAAEPVVVAFLPSAGGVGNSKLATEVGVWLKTAKATRTKRVCLVDLDFQTSHACAYLDIEPKLRIEEIASDPERLDEHLFEIFKSSHASGLDVIAAPPSKFDYDDISVDALDMLLGKVAKRYDTILIDLPLVWLPWTGDIVANADSIVLTGVNTIPCLHQIVAALTAVRSRRTDAVPLSVVLNRCEYRPLRGFRGHQHARQALGREKVFYVRDDPAAMVDSVNTGIPIVTSRPNSKIGKEIVAVADHCGMIDAFRASPRPTADDDRARRKVMMARTRPLELGMALSLGERK